MKNRKKRNILYYINMRELTEDDQIFFFGMFLFLSKVFSNITKEEMLANARLLYWNFVDDYVVDTKIFDDSTLQITDDLNCIWAISGPDAENRSSPIAILKLETNDIEVLSENFVSNIQSFTAEFSFEKYTWLVNNMFRSYIQGVFQFALANVLNPPNDPKIFFEILENCGFSLEDKSAQVYQYDGTYKTSEGGISIIVEDIANGEYMIEIETGSDANIFFKELVLLIREFDIGV